MRERYGFKSDMHLPYYHAKRLFDLALRRWRRCWGQWLCSSNSS
jgi:hypothetical protein